MTVYAVSVGDREYRVEVGESQLLVDGEPVAFELTSLNGNGLHLFRRGERSTEMYFKPASPHDIPESVRDAGGAQYEVVVNGRPLLARVDGGSGSGQVGGRLAHRRGRRGGADAGIDQGPGAHTRAPMPGLIVEVLVQMGQAVRKGDVLLTQESMKMQMQLRAPADGRVTAVRVKVGDQVEKGAVLVTMDAVADTAAE